MPSLPFLSSRHALGATLVLALVVRLGAVAAVGDRALAFEFATITENLLAGHGYDFYTVEADGRVSEAVPPGEVTLPSAYMPPAYPLFLWALTSLVGTAPAGVVVIEVVQAFLGVLGCWLIVAIGREWFDERTGLVAALGFALYPVLAFVPSQISAAALYVVLFLLFLWLLARAARTGRLGDAALAGLVGGLNVLARAEFALVLPLALAWLIVARTPGAWRSAGVFAVCAVAVLVPWTVRNAVVVEKATPLTTSGGWNLWVGHMPGAVGTHVSYAVPVPTPVPEVERAIEAVPVSDRYEADVDAVYGRAAREQIAADPLRSIRLGARKLWLFWGHFGGDDVAYPGAASPLFWGSWWLLVPPFLVGLWRSMRETPRRHGFLYAYLAVQSAVAAVFFVLPRYRLAVIPVMLLFAAHATLWVWDRYRSAPLTTVSAP